MKPRIEEVALLNPNSKGAIEGEEQERGEDEWE